MIPIGFPNSLDFLNLKGIEFLPTVMQISFFIVLLFTSVSLLISFLHLVWYSTSSLRSYLSLLIFLAVATPIFWFAYNIMPEVLFKLNV